MILVYQIKSSVVQKKIMGEVERMKLGSQGLEISKQGLGCMGMSAFYVLRIVNTDSLEISREPIMLTDIKYTRVLW